MADHTSGFNVYQDITLDPRFAGMFGLTESDVRQALQVIFRKENKVQKELKHMTTMFNGYRFSNESEITVFNTTTAMEYLQVSCTKKQNKTTTITQLLFSHPTLSPGM